MLESTDVRLVSQSISTSTARQDVKHALKTEAPITERSECNDPLEDMLDDILDT